MKILNTYEIQFTTAVDSYKEKLQPFNERTKQVFAENESQAVDRAYQKLMRDFPDSSKDIWEVKNIVKRADNILESIILTGHPSLFILNFPLTSPTINPKPKLFCPSHYLPPA